MSRSNRMQETLWLDAATFAQHERSNVTALYLSFLNESIDLDTKRVGVLEYHVAGPIWFLILSVSFIVSFTRRATMTSRFWLSLILIPTTIAIVITLTAELLQATL